MRRVMKLGGEKIEKASLARRARGPSDIFHFRKIDAWIAYLRDLCGFYRRDTEDVRITANGPTRAAKSREETFAFRAS